MAWRWLVVGAFRRSNAVFSGKMVLEAALLRHTRQSLEAKSLSTWGAAASSRVPPGTGDPSYLIPALAVGAFKCRARSGVQSCIPSGAGVDPRTVVLRCLLSCRYALDELHRMGMSASSSSCSARRMTSVAFSAWCSHAVEPNRITYPGHCRHNK